MWPAELPSRTSRRYSAGWSWLPPTPTGPAGVEHVGWNLLARVGEMPYAVLLFEARQTIRMHEPAPHREFDRDPHARWRDLIRRDDRPGTVYERRRCGACAEGGCALLDAARLFEAIVGPYLAAEDGAATARPWHHN